MDIDNFKNRALVLLDLAYSDDILKCLYFNEKSLTLKFYNLNEYSHWLDDKIFYIKNDGDQQELSLRTIRILDQVPPDINLHFKVQLFCGLKYSYRQSDLSFSAFGKFVKKELDGKGYFNIYKDYQEKQLIDPIYNIIEKLGFDPLIFKITNEFSTKKHYEIHIESHCLLMLDDNLFNAGSMLNMSLMEKLTQLDANIDKEVFDISDVEYYFELLKLLNY